MFKMPKLFNPFKGFKPFELYKKGDYSITNIFFHYEIHKEDEVMICQCFAIAVLMSVVVLSAGGFPLSFVGVVSLLGGLILIAHLILFEAKDWRNFIMDNFTNEIVIMTISLCVIIAGSFLPGGNLLIALGSAVYATALTAFVAGFFGEASPNVYMIEA